MLKTQAERRQGGYMDTTQENRTIEGYVFLNDKDAEMAALERRKIDYLEERMDYSQPDTILRIYEKAIHDRIFKTPVGLTYLKGIQDYLLEQNIVAPDEILPIPLYQSFGGELRENHNPAKKRIKPSEKKEKESLGSALTISVILNGLLVLAIISMFAITLKAEQPNIVNYKRVLTDQYASWEQELTQREQAVREKELEMKLEPEQDKE